MTQTFRAEVEGRRGRDVCLNCLWIVCFGFIPPLVWALVGVVCCCTIILIPFGKQCCKIAHFSLLPFGMHTHHKHGCLCRCPHVIGNILWLPIGLSLAATHILAAVVFFISICGIPFGYQHCKLARLAVWPFGAEIRAQHEVNGVLLP
mmetsp:Transcript_42960/g.103509  ORF Transcript_42960/g.103509 Transcript_42960/m.103509 type:complete len:148 (-) Transcript_42960:216-659(-)